MEVDVLLAVAYAKYVGIIAGILTSFSMLPQLIKMIKEKEVDDVSIPMLLVLFTGISLWVVYGYLQNDLPVLITNSFSVLVNLITIIFRFKYKKNS